MLAFLPALSTEFVNWDDHKNLTGNPDFRGLRWPQLRWMFTTTLMGHYIPLTWLSFGLNYALGGLEPFGYHLGNLLLHGASAAVFYLIARRLLAATTPSPPRGEGRGEGAAAEGAGQARAPGLEAGALVAALLFAVHPLRAESVAWATERRDVLSGLFYLLAVLAYLRGVEGGGPLSGRWRALSLGAFAAGLLSKSIVMTLPVTLLLLDLYPLGRRPLGWRTLLREKAGHVALTVAGAATALWAVRQVAGITDYVRYGPEARLAMVGYSLWFYPWTLVWPVDLSPMYELPRDVRLLDPRFFGAWLAVLAMTGLLAALARRWPAGLAAWAHSAIALAPVAGLVHAGYQLAHDRYSYLSGLGFALLGGAGVAWLIRGGGRGALPRYLVAGGSVAAALCLLGLGAGAWRQTRVWHDSATLWRSAMAADPGCAVCAQNLALALIQSGPLDAARRREAEWLFRAAIGLRPDRPDTYYNLASLLVWQKRFGEAEAVLQTYRRAFPDLVDAPLRLGMLARDRGAPGEALAPLRQALRIEPGHAEARRELDLALGARAAELEAVGAAAEADALRREAAALGAPLAPRTR